MLYKHIAPRETVRIDTLVNATATNLDKNYIFEGESHDFWEFQYAAKGSVFVHSNNDFYILRQGELTFFAPNEFHVIYGDGKCASELWVFSFQCACPLLHKFAHAILTAPDECVRLMRAALCETTLTFASKTNAEDGRILRRKAGAVIGGEQLIRNRLEELLILLLRCKDNVSTTARSADFFLRPTRQPLAESVHAYLKDHVNDALSLSMLASTFGVSVSRIKASYRAAYRQSPIASFHRMKTARAKELLAQPSLSVGDTAAALSFENVYYFSNFFKRQTGMSPTAYRSFVRNAQK